MLDIIGYQPSGDSYEPIYRTAPGMIVTQAFILCADCGGAISSTGGPSYGSLHVHCYENLKLKTFVEGSTNGKRTNPPY